MLAAMSEDTSKLRQLLRRAEETRARVIDQLVDERRPLIRGTFGTRGRVCGKAGCHCAQGELHESKYLSAAVGGQTRQVHVPARDELHVSEGVARYQRWNEYRKELARLSKEVLGLVDGLRRALLESYPPGDPIPPPARRGRKPKAAAGDERE
jgi:hypothetical protein